MYAITFDLDQQRLDKHYPGAHATGAYADIARVLTEHGFWRQQQSVYFSKLSDPVLCVLAVQEVQKRHPWFRAVVTDLRMLRIEEHNDLMPALGHPELPLDPLPDKRRRDGRDFKLN